MTTWFPRRVPADNDGPPPSGAGARQPVLTRLASRWDRAAVERAREERSQLRGEAELLAALRARARVGA